MNESMNRKQALRWSLCSGAVLTALSAVMACGELGRDKASEADIAQEQEDTRVATVQEAATVTTWLFREDFNTMKVTRAIPAYPYTSHNWYSQEDTNFNGELQRYRTYLYNDTLSTTGANGIVCDDGITDKNNCQSGNWTLRIVQDAGAADSVDNDVNGSNGDQRVLQMRAIRDTNTGTIYSARLNSKRFAEYVPTATTGLKYEIRMKYQANSISGGAWPAFWLLGQKINEDPVIGDGDNVSWPCDGSTEVDVMEVGSVWGRQYNKSSMHFGHTPCQPQVVKGTFSVDKTLTGTDYYDDGNWKTFAFEWEIDKARFFYNGVQYGNTIDTANGMFDTKMFMLLNFAAGGGLGGSVTTSQFDAGKSIYVDWIRVGSYSVNSGPTARTFSGTPSTVRLEAESNDEMLGVQMETCSEGGQNAGWTDPSSTQNDYIGWFINVPATANYKVRSRTAVNKPGGASSFAIHVRKENENYRKVLDMPVGDTGGWQNWQTFDTNAFQLDAGKYWIRIEFTGNSQNLNWIEVQQASAGYSCSDGIKNGSETGIDCGGSCSACPTCSDGVTNQGETAMDCGGPCPACGSGSGNGTGTTAGSTLQAEQYAQQSGTVLENGNTTLGYFGQNDWIRFQNVDMTNVSGLKFLSASGAGGSVDIITGCDTAGAGGTVRGTHVQANTGGWASWKESTVALTSFTSGTQSLCLKVTTSGDAWNIDWMQLITTDNSIGSGGNQAGGNLFANPGFESGVTGWQGYFLNGGFISTETVASAGTYGGKLTIDTGAGTSWHTQAFQVFTTQGTSYTVSVKGRNAQAGNKTFEVFCEQNGGSFTGYGTTSCTANDSTWTTCSVTCSGMPVGQGVKFGVKAGSDGSDLRLDEASLVKN